MDISIMEKTVVNVIKLTASEGMVLTNGEIYGSQVVYLGCNQSPENWSEITKEEYEKRKEENECQ